MFKRKVRPWLSDNNKPYPAEKPVLYDPSNYDFVRYVESNWHIVRDELLASIQAPGDHEEFRPYHDLEKVNRAAVWKTMGLMYWTMVSEKNVGLFPKTWEVFRKIPNITSCSLHILEPHATIKPHNGDTDAMLRCHMGLIVPAPLPRCGFRVANELVSWEEGKVFIFNDAREHTAWNNTEQNRYILSFDVMLPEYAKQKYWVASQVLGKINIEVAYQHVAWLRQYFASRPARAILIWLAKVFWRVRIGMRPELPTGF